MTAVIFILPLLSLNYVHVQVYISYLHLCVFWADHVVNVSSGCNLRCRGNKLTPYSIREVNTVETSPRALSTESLGVYVAVNGALLSELKAIFLCTTLLGHGQKPISVIHDGAVSHVDFMCYIVVGGCESGHEFGSRVMKAYAEHQVLHLRCIGEVHLRANTLKCAPRCGLVLLWRYNHEDRFDRWSLATTVVLRASL